MPLTIPNTTLQDDYTDLTTWAGNDVLQTGWFVVANNPAAVTLLVQQGGYRQGSVSQYPEQYLAPGTYPLNPGGKLSVAGIKARNYEAGKPVQFFGALYYPGEPYIASGQEYSATVAPGGGVTPVSGGDGCCPGTVQVLGPFRITSDDDLAAGVGLFSLEPGDLLYDWFTVVRDGFTPAPGGGFLIEAFNGATAWVNPDVGSFSAQLDIGNADDNSGTLSLGQGNGNPKQILQATANGGYYARTAVKVLEAGVLKVKAVAGYGPASAGDADVYVVAARPATAGLCSCSSGSGGISQVISTDGSVSVTHPDGPIVDLAVAAGGQTVELEFPDATVTGAAMISGQSISFVGWDGSASWGYVGSFTGAAPTVAAADGLLLYNDGQATYQFLVRAGAYLNGTYVAIGSTGVYDGVHLQQLGNSILVGGGAGSLGFFGHSPATQPATPLTLGDVIAAGQALGLWS